MLSDSAEDLFFILKTSTVFLQSYTYREELLEHEVDQVVALAVVAE